MKTQSKIYRIYQVVPDGGTILPSEKKSGIWKQNLYQPLVDMGHDVVLLDFYYDDFFVHAENDLWLRERRWTFTQKIHETFTIEHKKKPFDFCFFYLCDEFIDLGLIKEIQGKGVPVLNYSCNNVHQFHLVEKLTPLVDHAVYAEKVARPLFDRMGTNGVHMQMAANPAVYLSKKKPFAFDVTFIGQRYADRGSVMATLIQNGINVRAFGPRWDSHGEKVGNHTRRDKLDKLLTIAKTEGVVAAAQTAISKTIEAKRIMNEDKILKGHVGPVLNDEEMIELFSKSRINLGFSNVFMRGRRKGQPLSHIRLRDFEVPMCGAFYLTGYTQEIDEYFEPGKEIEIYSELGELQDKCRFYLLHDRLRTKIAEAARERSVRCHTWQHRFEKLFTTINLS